MIDEKTHALVFSSWAHHKIHERGSFVVSDVQSVSTTTMKWQITTPDSEKYTHALFDLDGTGEMSVIITEGSDRTDGTALVEINRNRVGTPPSAGTIVTRTPTGGSTDGAITIFSTRVGATNVGSKTVEAGGSRGVNEFMLKPNTKYVVAALTFAAIYVSFHVHWYEHINKSL